MILYSYNIILLCDKYDITLYLMLHIFNVSVSNDHDEPPSGGCFTPPTGVQNWGGVLKFTGVDYPRRGALEISMVYMKDIGKLDYTEIVDGIDIKG